MRRRGIPTITLPEQVPSCPCVGPPVCPSLPPSLNSGQEGRVPCPR